MSATIKTRIGQSSALTMGYEKEIMKKRTVELVAFCIMPNHFHLIVKELEEGGIATYMQRVLTAYSKYYNTKYEKSGHVFQGPYQAVHVGDNRQLLHLSAYIHRNPREISKWFNKEDQYQWSSYRDYIGENRWGDLLLIDIVLGQFKNKKKYHEFVKTSSAKLFV
ncbi:MAG: transposase [bacterium]|nr:transposase [bacterium]